MNRCLLQRTRTEYPNVQPAVPSCRWLHADTSDHRDARPVMLLPGPSCLLTVIHAPTPGRVSCALPSRWLVIA